MYLGHGRDNPVGAHDALGLAGSAAGEVNRGHIFRVDLGRDQGLGLAKAIRVAGGSRFRPILLTSLTTFAGLTPLLLEKSMQAQFLIPMAVSLAFGILFATAITLVIVPCLYLVIGDLTRIAARVREALRRVGGFLAGATP